MTPVAHRAGSDDGLLLDYRAPSEVDFIHSVYIRDPGPLRQVACLVRSHLGVTDHATVDENGSPRRVWIRRGAEWVEEAL
jgi:hypothetical protein